jgi:hypothetical protein
MSAGRTARAAINFGGTTPAEGIKGIQLTGHVTPYRLKSGDNDIRTQLYHEDEHNQLDGKIKVIRHEKNVSGVLLIIPNKE